METQFASDRSFARCLAWGETLKLSGAAGELRIERGRVWLTRQDDLDDHVLAAGDGFAVREHDVVVLEPWLRGEPTRVAWRPRAQPRREPDLVRADAPDAEELRAAV